MRWAKLIGSQDATVPESIAADSLGHIYVAGTLAHIGGSHTLRIGYDTVLSTLSYQRAGLIQLDTNGHFNWIRYAGDNSLPSLYLTTGPLAIDASNNVHTISTSWMYGAPLLPTLTSHYGSYDLTYDVSGNLLDVKRLDMDSVWYVNRAVIDPGTKKLYVIGELNRGIYGAGWALTQTSFTAAFDSNRNQLWMYIVDTPGYSPGATSRDLFTDIALDKFGHLYYTGVAQSMVTGMPSKFRYRSDSAFHSSGGFGPIAIIMKSDTNGNCRWIQHIDLTGSSINGLSELTILPNNQIAATGSFAGTLTGDGLSITTYSGEGQNPYFTILDTSKHIFSLQQLHGPGFYDWGQTITSNKKGDIFIGGNVESSIWGGMMTPFTSTGGNSDFFVIKYGVDCNCNYLPVADFASTGTRTVAFTYTGTTTGIDSVRWTFGDGGTSTVMNPTHIYSCSGTFAACVRVYTGCGSDMHCSDIYVPGTFTPGASFTHTGLSSISFTYTGPTVGADSIRWNFGDGSTSTLTNPIHPYTAVGTYTVCARIYWMCQVDSFCTTITVPCISPPLVTFSTAGTGSTKNFTYTGSTAGVTSISWDYGDGSPSGSGSATSHTYGTMGVYTVCVTATSPCGSNVVCTTVNITCLSAPVASYAKAGGMATRSFGYIGFSTGIDSVVWDFGDGGHANALSAAHTYLAVGVFTVCVTAYSQCGNSTWCDTVYLPCLAAPSSTFTVSGTDADSVRNFTYPGSMMGIDSARWTFTAGTGTSTTTSAMHTYSDTGSYVACLTLYSLCGTDSSCTTVYYHPHLPPIKTGFASLSTDNINIYPNPAHDELMIENAAGCEMKICDVVGREVLRANVGSDLQTIDIGRLESGVYVLQLNGAAGVKKLKVVKR